MITTRLPALALVTWMSTGCAASTEASEPRMIGAIESFFGECDGPCQQTLVMEGGRTATLRIQTYGGGVTLAEQDGTLTRAGLQRIEDIEASLPQLQASYGCPDCADEGAMRLSLHRQGTASTHTWEFDQPPAQLVAVDDFFTDVAHALRTCTDHADVRPNRGCTPPP